MVSLVRDWIIANGTGSLGITIISSSVLGWLATWKIGYRSYIVAVALSVSVLAFLAGQRLSLAVLLALAVPTSWTLGARYGQQLRLRKDWPE